MGRNSGAFPRNSSDGAAVPSLQVSLMDVRKELSFCQKTKLRVLGVVENMAGLLTPFSQLSLRDAAGADVTESALALLREKCPELLNLSAYADPFPAARGGAEAMAAAFGAPFLGRVPLDPAIGRACEAGASYTAAAAGGSRLAPIVERLRAIAEAAASPEA